MRGFYLEKKMTGNPKIWRYMDLTKFLAIIIQKELYFNRADNYEDIYEGELASGDKELLQSNPQLEIINQRDSTFINCWHENEVESAAMWKLYGNIDDAIAIETDLVRLRTSLPIRIEIRKVDYIDYDNNSIIRMCLERNHGLSVQDILAYKRKSFIHEQEYRAIYWKIPDSDELDEGMTWVHPKGINLSIDCSILIKKVHISPYASPLLESIIKTKKKKYDLAHIPVIKSQLYTRLN